MRWLLMGIAALAAFVLWAVPAVACQDPNIAPGGASAGSGWPPSAGPNEPFTVTISNVNETAHWELYVDGQMVASGEGEADRSVVTTFDFPDVGSSARTVQVSASITDVDPVENPPNSFPVRYRGTPAAPPPAPAKPGDAPAPQQAPAETQQPAGTQQPASSGHPTGGSGGSGGPGGSVGGPGRPGGGPANPSSPVSPVNPASPAAASAARSTGEAAERSTQAAERSTQRATTVREAGARERTESGRRRAPAAPLRTAVPTLAPRHGSELPAIPLVGLALLVVLGSAAAMLRYLRRPGGEAGDRAPVPVPWIPPEIAVEARARDVLIEAELQEMIAEARARELAEGREVAPIGPR